MTPTQTHAIHTLETIYEHATQQDELQAIKLLEERITTGEIQL